MSGTDVIRSLPRSNNGNHITEFEYVLLEVQSPVRTASGMGH